MDTEGPIAAQVSENAVQLDDLPEVLSTHHREQLFLSDMELEAPHQEDNWFGQYAVARSFIHSVL